MVIRFLGDNPLSKRSKKQLAVAWSLTEAKYGALVNATSEIVWLHSLLNELSLKLKSNPTLLCDNLGATHLSFNPVNHSRIRNIQIDLHFVRDLVQQGNLWVQHVHMQDQFANLLTKPLSSQCTQILCNKIRLADGSSILLGACKRRSRFDKTSMTFAANLFHRICYVFTV